MDSHNTQEIAFELPRILRIYKNGHVQRFLDTDFVPPSLTPNGVSVSSKDITINPETTVSARLYLPKLTHPTQKLPLLIYFPGGAFCVSSPFCSKYHNYLTKLVQQANVVAVSVNYRKAPEHPIPVAYEDSWDVLRWVDSHVNNSNDGPEPWLNNHADFERVFLCGESGGANIAHNLGMTAGNCQSGLAIGLIGIALVHPYFWGAEPIGSEGLDLDRKASVDRLWPFICPSNPDNDDPRVNPLVKGGPSLTGLGCQRVLIGVAEKDVLRDRGWAYYDGLNRTGWTGVVEILESEGKDHTFHLYDLESQEAKVLFNRLTAFLNGN